MNKVRLPYGLSHFKTLVSEGYYFVDKTDYIERIENLNERYIFLLRPRRFGKSLFISLLSHYYGLEHEGEFDELFGKYYIGKNPTPERNQYYILKFDFSVINTETVQSTLQGFLRKVRKGIQVFCSQYELFGTKRVEEIISIDSPAEMIVEFFAAFMGEKKSNQIYVLIDEYDHFANELIAFNFDEFSNIISKNGFVRKFYEALKEAAFDGIVGRFFATGVTPITLDSLTSGFNIATNITLEKSFSEMMGFTAHEVEVLISEICQLCPDCDMEQIMNDMRDWYNGYLFHKDGREKVYNSDMVLFFANSILKDKTCSYPEEMLDTNIASDYVKMKNLIKVKNREQNMSIIEELVENGVLYSQITRQYSFEKDFDVKDFISLLFYSGLVTISSSKGMRLVFTVPNYVIQQLYWDFFLKVFRENTTIKINTYELENAFYELVYDNSIDRFIGFIENTLSNLSNRDFISLSEKHIKLLFIVYANLSNLYYIKSEYEVQTGYPYIMFLYRKPFRPPYQFIFELKYIKKADKKKFDAVKAEAEKQMRNYLDSSEIKLLENLKAYIIVFVGEKVEVAEEIER
jgi:hypothetical protein